MVTLAIIVICGLLGVVGHWLNRYTQGRTESSFKDYMLEYKARTMQSITANLASSFTIYASLPEDIHGKPLVMVVIGAYMAGYTLDSNLNRDVKPEPKVKVQRAVKDDAKKSIDDLLDSDN